jgi:hypothetical protein
MADTDFTREIRAFVDQKPALAAKYRASWVVFVGDQFKGHFDSYEQAAEFALKRHRNETFLIRNTNAAGPDIPRLFVEG